ncbi:hypothetical protein ACXY7D_13865 [Sphingomonas melonis]|jgi:hypothetical protein
MGDAFEDGCEDDHGDGTCPICRGEELSPDFIALLERAASGEPVVSMTADEAIEWLRSR